MKDVNADYIAIAKKLNEEERERVLSRMVGKLPKRLLKEKLTPEEAIAIQLELEDEQLQEWRKNMADIQDKAIKATIKAKLKAEEKAAAKVEKTKKPEADKEVAAAVEKKSVKKATSKAAPKTAQ